MDQQREYIVDSLELHLFFARIMKEHAFFLRVGFLPPNAALTTEAERLQRRIELLLTRVIGLSDRAVRQCVLDCGEVVTEFTECAERQTRRLTGAGIDGRLTARVRRLRGCACAEEVCVTCALHRQVRQVNREAIQLVSQLIAFQERLLEQLCSCSIFTANYPLLIEHILREAKLYRAQLLRLEGRGDRSCQELRDEELFWNRIMMEHALFLRGLLDPGEDALIRTADGFAADYKRLLEASSAANNRVMRTGNPLGLTQKFRDFKKAGVSGIEECKIRSLILPLLADHVLREANHYIRLLEE